MFFRMITLLPPRAVIITIAFCFSYKSKLNSVLFRVNQESNYTDGTHWFGIPDCTVPTIFFRIL